MDPAFTLTSSTLAAIGAVLGALSGAITFLFRQLIVSKDAQIKACQDEIARLQAVRATESATLRAERDFFRDLAFKALARARTRAMDAPDLGGP